MINHTCRKCSHHVCQIWQCMNGWFAYNHNMGSWYNWNAIHPLYVSSRTLRAFPCRSVTFSQACWNKLFHVDIIHPCSKTLRNQCSAQFIFTSYTQCHNTGREKLTPGHYWPSNTISDWFISWIVHLFSQSLQNFENVVPKTYIWDYFFLLPLWLVEYMMEYTIWPIGR